MDERGGRKNLKPLVSVITPAYNAEAYIGAAIESVQAQTYDAWELVIAVDEGSKDRTKEVVLRYAARDPRVKCFPHSPRRMAAARNLAISHASGVYVTFLDADNLFLRDAFERGVAFLEAHPDVGLAYGGIYHFYNDHPEDLYQNKNELRVPTDDTFKHVLATNFLNVLSVMLRKECLTSYNAFPEGWRACDEQYLWVNLAYRGVKFERMPGVVGLLRLHSTNDSFRRDHILDTAIGVLRLLREVSAQFTPDEKQRYDGYIAQLTTQWKRKLLLGKLLAHPLTSWLFMPLYRRRREHAYYQVGTRTSLRIS